MNTSHNDDKLMESTLPQPQKVERKVHVPKMERELEIWNSHWAGWDQVFA